MPGRESIKEPVEGSIPNLCRLKSGGVPCARLAGTSTGRRAGTTSSAFGVPRMPANPKRLMLAKGGVETDLSLSEAVKRDFQFVENWPYLRAYSSPTI